MRISEYIFTDDFDFRGERYDHHLENIFFHSMDEVYVKPHSMLIGGSIQDRVF